MKQQYIYTIADNNGKNLGVAHSREQAREMKRKGEEVTNNKLHIQRFIADKKVR